MAREAIKINNPLWPAAFMERKGGSHSVVQWFENVSMAYGHDGLTDIAKKAGLDPVKLEPGQFLVFTNKARNKVKVFTAAGCIAYRRLAKGHITLESISAIPAAFQATRRVATRPLPETFVVPTGKRILIRNPTENKK